MTAIVKHRQWPRDPAKRPDAARLRANAAKLHAALAAYAGGEARDGIRRLLPLDPAAELLMRFVDHYVRGEGEPPTPDWRSTREALLDAADRLAVAAAAASDGIRRHAHTAEALEEARRLRYISSQAKGMATAIRNSRHL